MDEVSGRLRLEWDTGIVYLRHDSQDDEFLGFIGDPDNCPAGLERSWAYLNDLWEDSRLAAIGQELAVEAAYFGRFSPAHWN